MLLLTRGQKTKLADLTSATQLRAVISATASVLQFDFSCFGIDSAGQLSDDRYFVFFNQKSSPEGAISMSGSGEFSVDLSKIPASIQKLVFVATIDGTGEMRALQSGSFSLQGAGSEVARFEFRGADFAGEKAIIAAEIYRKDVWRLSAVGQGFAGGLAALLKQFGGQEIAPSAPPPPSRNASPSPLQPNPAPLPSTDAPTPAPVSLSKVTLEKKGEKSKLDLRKGGGVQPIRVNLNWDAPQKKGFFSTLQSAPDLDLGCMYRLKTGEMGVVQPLGKNFGSQSSAPFIFLDKDDRSGAASDGENLTIFRPDLVDLILIFAMVYEGASDFAAVGGRLTLKEPSGKEIFMRLNTPERNRNFCAICSIRGVGSSVEITKEELYYPGHREADARFGFGFRWKETSK
ncbi:tellurite resistance protein TerA [Abditibacterium utsteinense]|uniref:Tellurite resistance protein TerA n=1 Tax=Abditibacterium utsteinense TaxID=1960156 RepID=A0A2S8SQ79_9BACT|nr:TerD family protein [Abditibacterium utsteinense]PQV62944.1 tellurite resistance protein TerA [Abditibacterium utsteinense]